MIKTKFRDKTPHIVNIISVIIIFTACLWDLGSLERIRVVDDGFCYWGMAAYMSGYDWSELISVSAYYSYGYSIILIPLFLLYRLGASMTFIYRLAVVMNACFLSACYFMALYMLKKIFRDIPDGLKYIAALSSTLYVGNIAQAGLAWTETFLLFMFWCVVVLLYKVIKKPGYGNIFGLALTTAWLFAIHMRALGVVMAVCVILIAFFISRRKEINKKYIFYAIALAAFFLCVVLILKNYVNSNIYLGSGDESINNVGSNVSRFASLLNIRGIIDLALSFIGKIFYISCSTFLLALAGLFAGIVFIFKALFKNLSAKTKNSVREKWGEREWFVCFALLSFLAEIGIEAIFKALPFFRSIEDSLRDDALVYGRYADFVVGPVLILGIFAVYNLRSHYKEVVLSIFTAALSAVIVQFLYNIMAFRKGTDTVGFRFGAVPWLAVTMDGHKTDFACEIIIISILIFIVLCVPGIIKNLKWRAYSALLLAAAAVWCVAGISGGMDYTASKQDKAKSVDTVARIVETAAEDAPVYMAGGANTEVKILQWMLAERSIHLCEVAELKNINTSGAVILGNSSNAEDMAALSEKFDFLYDSGYISIFISPDNDDYAELSVKALEMAHAAEPSANEVSLSEAATGLSYTKMNGSLYYNYQSADGGYMTKEIDVEPEDGTYEFTIDMRALDCAPGTDIGYITVGDDSGKVQYMKTLAADSFIEKPRQQVKVSVDIKDWARPVIGLYTYGEASIRVYGISYIKTDGCVSLDSYEAYEMEEIGAFLDTAGEKGIVYVDSDDSARTGFPQWEGETLYYLPGRFVEYKTDFEDSYYIVEKTDMGVINTFKEKLREIYETDAYYIFAY